MNSAAHANDGKVLLKNEMLDGLLASPEVDASLFDSEQGRQNIPPADVLKFALSIPESSDANAFAKT